MTMEVEKMDIHAAELAPYCILPAQFGDSLFGGARTHPEKCLQLAVLSDAVQTFQQCAGVERKRAQRLFAEVDDWFASDGADGPFAFVAICDSLGFDPDFVRSGLRRRRAFVENTGKRAWSFRRDRHRAWHQVVPRRESRRGRGLARETTHEWNGDLGGTTPTSASRRFLASDVKAS